MIRILKSHSAIIAIIYIIPIIQFGFRIGLFFNGILIGLFPAAILYFIWLLLLCNALGHEGSKKKAVIAKLFFSIFIVHPLHCFLLNLKMLNDHIGVMVDPIGSIIFFWLLYVVIDSWLFIGKSIQSLINGSDFRYIFFSDYRKFFFLFLGGIFTIWWLQPNIIKAIDFKQKLNSNPPPLAQASACALSKSKRAWLRWTTPTPTTK